MNSKRMLNLGCGCRFHKDWINIDIHLSSPCVSYHDLSKPLPYPDNYFEVVYHSHVLEHFTKSEGKKFLKECFRVLKPNGTIRIAVPDLETIARLYINYLDQCLNGVPSAEKKHYWMILELYDQTVRQEPGGEMANFLKNIPNDEKEFIIKRVGDLFTNSLCTKKNNIISSINNNLYHARKILIGIRYSILKLFGLIFLGKKGLDIIEEVYFRHSGEHHKWMYDFYSLQSILKGIGFVDIRRCSAIESRVSGWEKYYLDTNHDGSIYKPDSLYCEGCKPR